MWFWRKVGSVSIFKMNFKGNVTEAKKWTSRSGKHKLQLGQTVHEQVVKCPLPTTSTVEVFLRCPISSVNIRRINSSLSYHIFSFLVHSLLSRISILGMQLGMFSFCMWRRKKISCCPYSICCLCHVLLLPTDLSLFHCYCYLTHPATEHCWCHVATDII